MRCKQCMWVAILVLAGTSGCAMCDNVEDGTYAAFGGKWQRDNLASGRVGSVFDPAGMQVVDAGTPTEAEPELAEPPEAEEETTESLLTEPDQTPEAADLLPAEPSGTAETSETMENEPSDEPAPDGATASDAQADLDPAPAPDGIGLPEMPDESAERSQPKAGDNGLLPPLDPPPQ